MKDAVEWLAALVNLNNGTIIGKTRLQKIVFLLEEKGLGFGFSYDYHNYGPYSAELSFAIDDAEALRLIKTERRPGYHEVPYTIFEATNLAPNFEEDEKRTLIGKALSIVDGYSALVLELAATAIYLKNNGYAENYWSEVKKRKPLKADKDRIQKAKKLLSDLHL
jgi:uncharacterized protein YwgA